MVEAAAAVSVAGIVLAVFIPTFLRELRTSKTSEAAEQLALLYRRSAAYFESTHLPGAPEDEAAEEGDADEADDAEEGEGAAPTPELEPRTRCLPPTAGPTPRMPTREPERVDFTHEDTPGHDTWRALGFQPPRPVRYSYTFEPTASGCGLRSPEGTYLLTLRAEGDLDGDGERSVFERRFRATEDGRLEPFGILYVRDRVE
jgi:type II secretory pathway pseudopilin PulG